MLDGKTEMTATGCQPKDLHKPGHAFEPGKLAMPSGNHARNGEIIPMIKKTVKHKPLPSCAKGKNG